MYQVDSSTAVQCHAIVLGYDRHNIHTYASYPDTLKERKKKDKETQKILIIPGSVFAKVHF